MVERLKEIYEETSSVIKVGDTQSGVFWAGEGVRQGCPLSPTLFTLYVTDLEEEMEKTQVGGIVIGNRKFSTLAYADDIVLVANREDELKEMIKRLEKYLDRKKLWLNVEKSKVMEFRKRGGRRKKIR